jgi:hypothetical protein
MKKFNIAACLLLALGGGIMLTRCTKPTKDFEFSINAKVFDQTVGVQFYDPKNPAVPPQNITLTIEGPDAGGVYEISGRKVFTVVDGIISLGIHPSLVPTEDKPVEFVLRASAPGYMSVRQPIKVTKGAAVQMMVISMINIDNPPAGVTVVTENVPLTGGSTTADVNIATTPAPGEPAVSLAIPQGTSFRDVNGNPINGGSLEITMVGFNTLHAGATNAFPGGYASDDITDENGNKIRGLFTTAGFMDVEMSIGGVEVRQFSQPVNMSIGLANGQINPVTGAAFAAGNQIPVWSYNHDNGAWAFEQNATVTENGGQLSIPFAANHLTGFSGAEVTQLCTSGSIVFNTGLSNTESFLIDIITETGTFPITKMVQVGNGAQIQIPELTQESGTINVYRNTAENSQTDWNVRSTPVGTYTGQFCPGSPITVNLNVPAATPITFDIQGRCTNSNAPNAIVRPTVDVWYRLKNSNSIYSLLGQVQNGYFATTNLNYMSSYDFKVIWNGNTTFLRSKTIDSLSYQREIVVPAAYQQHFCQ